MKCEFCGKELFESEAFTFDGVTMCRDCMENQTVICDRCNTRIWAEDDEGSDCISLCQDCYDQYYTHCERCGRLISYDYANYLEYDDDTPYCESCYSIMSENAVIHEYSYKPEPVFHGDDKLYLGVELEIDNGGECSDNAERLLDIANFQCDNMFIKRDGSIDDGFELVTHPMALEYHEKEMPWRKILNTAVTMHYRSHNTKTCGLHCHVSRSAFGDTYEKQEEVIARIVYFVEAHWNELLKFSRRTETTIMRWASRYGIAENTKMTYDKAKKGNMGRYVCVNLQNSQTVEFRIFRGTLRYETLIAALQLVHEICTAAISMSDKEFESMSWCDFVSRIKDKPELVNYLKLKRLYVNEPIAEEADI